METKKVTYIYGLIDPRTDQVRYVGKSNNPKYRFWWHTSHDDDTHKSRWINELKRNNLKPELIILEEIPHEKWVEKEQWWINHFKKVSITLTNSTDGGKGTIGASPDTRLKMSRARLGIKLSDETKEKLRNINLGKKASDDTRAKLSLIGKGRPKSIEHRQKMSLIMKGKQNCLGRQVSDETKKKMSIAATGNKGRRGQRLSQEHKDKIGLGHRGKKSPLSKQDVIEIRQKVTNGIKRSELAKQYNVPYDTICRVVSRKIFKWVE